MLSIGILATILTYGANNFIQMYNFESTMFQQKKSLDITNNTLSLEDQGIGFAFGIMNSTDQIVNDYHPFFEWRVLQQTI